MLSMFPRSAVARTTAFSARRVIARPSRPTHVLARFQSTSSTSYGSSARSFDASHVAAGVAGGLTVVLAGYAWYHTSGLKNIVQSAKEMKGYLQTTRDRVLSKATETSKNPSRALSNLRGIAKSYTFFIPGANAYIDDTFDDLEVVYETHSDEMDLILKETTESIIKTTANNNGKKRRAVDLETARDVYEIVGNGVKRMKEVGKKAGGDLLDRSPVVKEKLGGAYEQLQSLAQRAGPEGRRALREAREQVKELVSGNKVDESSIKNVREIIQSKTAGLRKQVSESEDVQERSGSE